MNTLLLSLDHCVLSRTAVQALRRQRLSADGIIDLAASIKAHGVLQPILVRVAPGRAAVEPITYEIVAGERRYMAADRAGLDHIPAIVRELSDAQVIEAQLAENIQRDDLRPLEEATGYQELRDTAHLAPEEIARRLGKSRSWVYQRLRLLSLSDDAKAALAEGAIDVSRAVILSSLEHKRQNAVLPYASQRNGDGVHYHSVRDLQQHLRGKGHIAPLQDAPWQMDDDTLVTDAGTCSACPHRIPGEVDERGACAQPACYKAKFKAHVARTRAAAIEQGRTIIEGDAADKIVIRPRWAGAQTEYVGHIDLDAECEDDHFAEPEPEDGESPEWDAWYERNDNHQPRTWRQIVGELDAPPPLIEDPKTGLLREIIPFTLAQARAQAAGITVPDYRAPAVQHQVADPAERKRLEEQQAARREKERAHRLAILAAIWPKSRTAFTVDELREIVQDQCAWASRASEWWKQRECVQILTDLNGGTFPDLDKANAAELAQASRCWDLAQFVDPQSSMPNHLNEAAKEWGIDPKKIKAEKAEAKPKGKKGKGAKA